MLLIINLLKFSTIQVSCFQINITYYRFLQVVDATNCLYVFLQEAHIGVDDLDRKEAIFREVTEPLLLIAKRHEGYQTLWQLCYDLSDTRLLRSLMVWTQRNRLFYCHEYLMHVNESFNMFVLVGIVLLHFLISARHEILRMCLLGNGIWGEDNLGSECIYFHCPIHLGIRWLQFLCILLGD